jgi:DNA-binding NarL/FixJ family response regulator
MYERKIALQTDNISNRSDWFGGSKSNHGPSFSGAGMKWARILIADDQTLVAEGLSKLLENHCECVGTVTDGASLLRAVDTTQPHAVLLDISMPQLNGFEAARQIHKRYPEIKLLFVTIHGDPEYVTEAFGAGASGYVLKSSAGDELIKGLKEVLRGNKFVSAELTSTTASSGSPKGRRAPGRGLTPRQRQVLQMLCEGNPAKIIAHTLNISTKTVEFHKTAMMRAVGAQNTAELIRFAVETSLAPTFTTRRNEWTAHGS